MSKPQSVLSKTIGHLHVEAFHQDVSFEDFIQMIFIAIHNSLDPHEQEEWAKFSFEKKVFIAAFMIQNGSINVFPGIPEDLKELEAL